MRRLRSIAISAFCCKNGNKEAMSYNDWRLGINFVNLSLGKLNLIKEIFNIKSMNIKWKIFLLLRFYETKTDTRDSFVLRVRLRKVVGRRFPSRWKRVASKAIP